MGHGSTPVASTMEPEGNQVFFAFRNQTFLESKGDAFFGHVRQLVWPMHTYAKWQHTESSPMSPPRVAISGKKNTIYQFWEFQLFVVKRFCAKTNNDDPFFPAACGASPGVYFRQQNSDDSKSLIDSFFCSVDHALNLPLGFCWCHGVIGVTIGFLSEKKTKDLGLGFCSFPEIGVLSLIFLWPGISTRFNGFSIPKSDHCLSIPSGQWRFCGNLTL